MRTRMLAAALAGVCATGVLLSGCQAAGTGERDASGSSVQAGAAPSASSPDSSAGDPSASSNPSSASATSPAPESSPAKEPTKPPSDDPGKKDAQSSAGKDSDTSGDDKGGPGKGDDGKSEKKKDSGTSEKSDKDSGKPAAPKPLKLGDKGARVTALQKQLLAAGYWLSSADGTFGPTTQQAVFAVQKTAGLSRDGAVGQKTQKALDSGALPKPRSSASSTGRIVEVDLKRQLVLLVTDGRVETVLNTSTGSNRQYVQDGQTHVAVTPRGHFTVSRQIDGPRQSKLGYLWRPKYFNGGIALHGEHNDVPAYAASHGCVRVTDAAMNWIWKTDQVPLKTKVWVY